MNKKQIEKELKRLNLQLKELRKGTTLYYYLSGQIASYEDVLGI